jgi:hypothetical protein
LKKKEELEEEEKFIGKFETEWLDIDIYWLICNRIS